MSNAQNVIRFVKHVDESVEQMLDMLTTTGYEDRFNVQITMNGELLNLEMNADTYSRLDAFLTEEAHEFAELDGLYDRIKPLAELQVKLQVPMDLLIKFEHIKSTIVNPFKGVGMRYNVEVNPYEAYGKSFLKSDWFNEDKVAALEVYINENR